MSVLRKLCKKSFYAKGFPLDLWNDPFYNNIFLTLLIQEFSASSLENS